MKLLASLLGSLKKRYELRVKELPKRRLISLAKAIKREDCKAVDRLLEIWEVGLPEFFLGMAEDTGSTYILQSVLSHFGTYGFDETTEGPLMTLVKSGHIPAVFETAKTLSFARDFSTKDERGLNVLDYAKILGDDALHRFLSACFIDHFAEEWREKRIIVIL